MVRNYKGILRCEGTNITDGTGKNSTQLDLALEEPCTRKGICGKFLVENIIVKKLVKVQHIFIIPSLKSSEKKLLRNFGTIPEKLDI